MPWLIVAVLLGAIVKALNGIRSEVQSLGIVLRDAVITLDEWQESTTRDDPNDA